MITRLLQLLMEMEISTVTERAACRFGTTCNTGTEEDLLKMEMLFKYQVEHMEMTQVMASLKLEEA